VGIQPTSRASLGFCPKLVDMEQGFEPFEGKFNLPPESVDSQNIDGWKFSSKQ
jgi:hypothetical protein